MPEAIDIPVAPELSPVRTALLSVSDKTGLIPFATFLAEQGVRLISTGGTAAAIKAAGLEVTSVDEITEFPEMMDGRVKTLHPKIHGGLLALRDKADHAQALKDHAITPIDLVVVNLYPFEETLKRPDLTAELAIENIDIGGPSMVRSSAKNHAYVTLATDPSQYEAIQQEMAEHNGATTLQLRRKLATAAFTRTASYDTAISQWMKANLQ